MFIIIIFYESLSFSMLLFSILLERPCNCESNHSFCIVFLQLILFSGAVCHPDYTHSPTSTTHLPRTHHKHHRRSKTDPGTSTASAPCLNRTGITKKKKTVEEKSIDCAAETRKGHVTTRKGQTTRKISTRNVRIMKAPSEPVTQPNTSKPGKGLLRIPLRTRQVHEIQNCVFRRILTAHTLVHSFTFTLSPSLLV